MLALVAPLAGSVAFRDGVGGERWKGVNDPLLRITGFHGAAQGRFNISIVFWGGVVGGESLYLSFV